MGTLLTFNTVLRAGDLDPARVLLLRHSDNRVQRELFHAALQADPRFDDYQRSQSNPRVITGFRKSLHVAGFVVDEGGNTVFAGIWSCLGEAKVNYEDPFVGGEVDQPGRVIFETKRNRDFDAYRGRLIIDWGKGMLAWSQRAHRRDKAIVELRKHAVEAQFPGPADFHAQVSEIGKLPSTWIAVLKSMRGVYLLVNRHSGRQYVGAALGDGGFFSRWVSYQDGHGGNMGMRQIEGKAADYDVSILETAGSSQSETDVLAIEARWKRKLESRRHGLNRN